MKKNRKQEEISIPQETEFDIADIIVKIQQQLASLENKIDSLVAKSSERSFKRFDHFRGRENRDQGSGFRERRFTKAVCADCHQECEVPFKPTGDRPVYCKDCFSKRRPAGSFQEEPARRPHREEDFSPREYSDKKHGRKGQGHGARKPVSRRRKERA